MKIKIIVPILIGLILVAVLIPTQQVSAGDPVGVNSSLFNIDLPNGGDGLINLAVENSSSDPVEVKVSLWHDYTYPDTDERWIDPTWVTLISPDHQILPVGGQMISNIQFNIPADAEDIQYKTWIKVSVDGWEKPVTVIIRKGAAIDKIDFSVSPGYYRLSVSGYPAHLDTDIPITIKSKTGMSLDVFATAETPGMDIIISESSSISHTPDEIGLVFEPIKTKDAVEWFTPQYTMDSPLSLNSYEKDDLYWSLDIPDSLKNGHYAFGIRVQPNVYSGMIVENYVIWVLLDVDRDNSEGGTSDTWAIIGICGLVGVIVSLGYLVKRAKGNKRKANEYG